MKVDDNLYPNIKATYSNEFRESFSNKLQGWGFSKDFLQQNKGKLLEMDIDFGNTCSLNCPHCFRRDNKVDNGQGKELDYEETVRLIKEAKKLGLKQIKFLGAGEPLENKNFIELLRFLKKEEIIPVIFTKGHVIGDDKLAETWHKNYGIKTGKHLAEELYKNNASIILGFNSIYSEKQDKIVGNIKGYTEKRNKALEILAQAGFNKKNPTRICLAILPITHENFDEAFEIYKWAIRRNLLPLLCPTMISGRCGEENWRKITPPQSKLIELYKKIYLFNINNRIQTLEQIKEEGISAYAGIHPCNQVSCGIYIALGGKVLRCPGDDITVFGDIRKNSLKEIWRKSENFKRAGCFNCKCPPKEGKSFGLNFYTKVLNEVEKSLK